MLKNSLLSFILLYFIDEYIIINTIQKALNILQTKQYSNIIKININNFILNLHKLSYMLVMELGCCLLLLLFQLLIHLHKQFHLIGIDPVQIRAPQFEIELFQLSEAWRKGTWPVPFRTNSFRIQTRSVLVMSVVMFVQ